MGGPPLVGSTLDLARDVLGFYERAAKRGDVVEYRYPGGTGVAVLTPDAVREVLVEKHDRFEKGALLGEQLGSALGEGLLLAEGERWKAQRESVAPAFYREAIEGYAEAMGRHAAATAGSWADGERVDVGEAMAEHTLAVLGETLLGVDVSAEGEAVRRTARAMRVRFDASRVGAYLPEWLPLPANRRYRRAVADARELVDDLVARADGEGEDLLSLFVRAKEAGVMDDAAVRDNALTFLFAGHETSALAATYALHLLAHNPEVQERLAAEARSAGALDAGALDDLDLAERVIDEAIRLYPPAYTHFREPTEDVTIGGYRVPAGTTVSLPQYQLQRDDRWWETPEAFDPWRWEGGRENPEYAYFPFSGGPRHCIGMRFARAELKLTLAAVLREWELVPETPRDVELNPGVNLSPGESIEVTVRKR